MSFCFGFSRPSFNCFVAVGRRKRLESVGGFLDADFDAEGVFTDFALINCLRLAFCDLLHFFVHVGNHWLAAVQVIRTRELFGRRTFTFAR